MIVRDLPRIPDVDRSSGSPVVLGRATSPFGKDRTPCGMRKRADRRGKPGPDHKPRWPAAKTLKLGPAQLAPGPLLDRTAVARSDEKQRSGRSARPGRMLLARRLLLRASYEGGELAGSRLHNRPMKTNVPENSGVRLGGRQHAAFNIAVIGSGACGASTATLRLDTSYTGPRFRPSPPGSVPLDTLGDIHPTQLDRWRFRAG